MQQTLPFRLPLCAGDREDFLAMLADWGGPSPCDFDRGGTGITDFLLLLGNWGPCP